LATSTTSTRKPYYFGRLTALETLEDLLNKGSLLQTERGHRETGHGMEDLLAWEVLRGVRDGRGSSLGTEEEAVVSTATTATKKRRFENLVFYPSTLQTLLEGVYLRRLRFCHFSHKKAL
jgi:hypothetical protein